MSVMAIGIGLSVYMFAFFNTILYKDLSFKDGESLVVLNSSHQGQKNGLGINIHDYLEVRKSVKGLSEIGGYQNLNVIVSGRDGARRYQAVSAEANIFELTRTKAILGRTFTHAENKLGSEKVVIIGFDLWQKQFAGDKAVLDKDMRIDGSNHRVIGVMPSGYLFPRNAQIWLPMQLSAEQLSRSTTETIHGLAHLDDGVTMSDINKQLDLITKRIADKYPQTHSGVSAYVATIPGSGGSGGEPVIYTMHTVAILILLLASINVGNLLLSRAVERGKETAIRVALGAPRSRLISQMLWESIIICTLGGLVGFLVMAWGLEQTESIVATFYADPMAFWWKFYVDDYTVKLTLGIIVSTILVTGLIPAWKNSGGDFNAVLRDGTRGALGKKAGRLNKLLVTSEIFISITVLIAAAVLVQSSYEQSRKDIGANTKNTLVANILLNEERYTLAENKIKFVNALASQLENNSAINDVMIASALPGHYSIKKNIAIKGKEYNKASNTSFPKANYIVIMPGSLAKLGVELQQGRYFNEGDNAPEKATVLITESFANFHFPKQSAIGQQIRLASNDKKLEKWLTIVGIVEHTIQGNRDTDANIPSIFRPLSQDAPSKLTLAMTMNASVTTVAKTLRHTLQGIDSEVPSYRIETYQASNERITAPVAFISSLTALFAIAAVFLAASGIYGVMSNTINQRTQEIGIKRALGADETRVMREYLLAGAKLLVLGGIPGILLGGFMGVAMGKMFGTDMSILLSIITIMLTIIGLTVMTATYLPTQRVLKMEPSQALHYE
jgi:predicted permease